MSAFMTALKRGERLLTVRVFELERLLHGRGGGRELLEAPEWEPYVWSLFVLTQLAQATGSAPSAPPAPVPPQGVRAVRRPPAVVRKA